MSRPPLREPSPREPGDLVPGHEDTAARGNVEAPEKTIDTFMKDPIEYFDTVTRGSMKCGDGTELDWTLADVTFDEGALLPEIFRMFYPSIPFNFGGTSLLILVVVTMDFMSQMQAHAMSHQYEGMMQKANLRNYGRSGTVR